MKKKLAPRRTPKSPDQNRRSNEKLETRLRTFAFVRKHAGGLAFWCMLGAYLGYLVDKAFKDRVKKSN